MILGNENYKCFTIASMIVMGSKFRCTFIESERQVLWGGAGARARRPCVRRRRGEHIYHTKALLSLVRHHCAVISEARKCCPGCLMRGSLEPPHLPPENY